MQTKKYLARAFGHTGVVEVLKISECKKIYTVLDGDFLRHTWFCDDPDKPHHFAKKVNGKWVLEILDEYIVRKLSSLEYELY